MKNNFNDIYKHIGANLKARRKELKLSQEEVGLRATPKIDRAKVSDMENGKEDFYFSTLLRICDVLDIDVSDIVSK
ncbi:helix-turn-helix domain-containing protein [Myroides sp. LJL110]